MPLKIVYEYKSAHFSYSIRESPFRGRTLFFINCFIAYDRIHKHVAEKNNLYGCTSVILAKKKIMKYLKDNTKGTSAEEPVKKLPIFIEEGYQESLF